MWLAAQLKAGGHMLAGVFRVEDNYLRKQAVDKLPELLKAIAEAKQENPALEL